MGLHDLGNTLNIESLMKN